ncbi:MAG: hypothetical protein V2J24_11640 [Pseudomonadales bacterium]|nr:hypothetical protein [Pseudomonadales bacterium]
MAEPFACPACGGHAFSVADRGWTCDSCALEFPLLDGVPALYPDPDAALGGWRARLHAELRALQSEWERIDATLESGSGSELTRSRLRRLRDARRAYHDELRTLCAPLLAGRPAASEETYNGVGTLRLPRQGITSYEANAHRDWCWGRDENEASVAALQAVVTPDRRPRRLLVLGSGAGRLAYDLHDRWDCEITVALDHSPLLTLIAARAARGEAFELHEFPLAPRTLEDHAVARRLGAPAPARDGLHYVLGDALRAPLREGWFDAVLTPWLLDVLPTPPEPLVARVNALLAPGGSWLYFGSVNFMHQDPARCLALEELLEIAGAAGFGEARVHDQRMPYLCSPASRHARFEETVAFRAERLADAREVAAPEEAIWLGDTSRPVPRLPALELRTLASRVQLAILELLDGRRSIDDVARELERHQLMPRDEARAEVRTFVARILEEAERVDLG